MNTATEQQLLVLACQAFEASTKLNAHVVSSEEGLLSPSVHSSYQVDGCLRIGPHEQLFLVEAKARLLPGTIGQLRTLKDKVGEPVVLRWSRLGAQKQDVYFLSHERKKQQIHAG